MRKKFPIAFVAGLSCLASAQSPAELTKQVRDVDFRFMQAIGNGDHKTLDEILDKDVVIVTFTGKIGPRDQMIRTTRTGTSRVTHASVDHETVVLHGDTAVVSDKTRSKGLVRGHKVDTWLQILRVYKRRGGKWTLITYQSTPILSTK